MKKKAKVKVGRVVALLAALVVAVYLAALLFDVFGVFANNRPVTVEVVSGDTFQTITDRLHEQGIVKHPLVFRVYARLFGNPAGLQTGEHPLDQNYSYGTILRELTTKREGTVQVTFPEGLEIYRVCDLFVENELMTQEEFYDVVNNASFDYWFLEGIDRENRLEGYLYPDTYTFSRSEKPEDMIRKMLENFEAKVGPEYRSRAQELGYSFDDMVILASIIEREADGEKDRDLVSSVFHNRLKSTEYPYLQSCATVQYVLKERKAVLSEADTKIDSPYNTYQNKGLPVGPICSPGISAIKAALYPADTDYYFFAVGADGVQRFAKTYDEHLQNTQQ